MTKNKKLALELVRLILLRKTGTGAVLRVNTIAKTSHPFDWEAEARIAYDPSTR